MEREVTPGYEPWGEQGMKLIDPADCPAGHPFRFGQRGYERCRQHRGHPSWVCACGREQFLRREDGAIVQDLPCREPNYGQQGPSR